MGYDPSVYAGVRMFQETGLEEKQTDSMQRSHGSACDKVGSGMQVAPRLHPGCTRVDPALFQRLQLNRL